MNSIRYFLLSLFLVVFMLPVSTSAGQPIGKRIVLENGMVLLLAEKHDLPMVTVNAAIKAGSTLVPREKPGLASLTAALLMEGTKRRDAGQISSEIDFVGGALSVSGGHDYASASLQVLTKDLRTGLDLLSDVLMNPAFRKKDINRKVKEMLAEIKRQQEEPGTVADEAFAKAVFGSHPYGRTNEEVAVYLKGIKRRHIVDFHRAQYGPGNTIIAVVGDVSEQSITTLLNEYFKGWSRKAGPLPAAVAAPTLSKTKLFSIDKTITQANIVMGHRGISRNNPDYYAVIVMNFILGGGGFSSRLMDNIRDNRGLAYSVSSYFSARKEPGAFVVELQTKNESANEAIAEIMKEMRRMKTTPVSTAELADAKSYIMGSFPLRMDTYAKIAGILTFVELYSIGLEYPRKYLQAINAVTRKDVLRVAQTYLHPDRLAIVVVADQKKAKLKLSSGLVRSDRSLPER